MSARSGRSRNCLIVGIIVAVSAWLPAKFDRKVDGQRWLAEITTSMATGTFVGPVAGKLAFR